MVEMTPFAPELIERQIALVFEAWGMAPDHIEITVPLMVEADRRGIDSHGIGMLPQYERQRIDGKIIIDPKIEWLVDLPAIGLIDAGHSLGHVPAHMAMQAAIAKAKETGVGAVVVRDSNHFGAAGVYATMALDHDMIGFCTTGTSQRSIVPTFAREPMFSTNPIALAAPAGKNPPFVLDMATSTVAVGKLNIARRAHKPLPVGWALKPDGSTETDADAAFNSKPKRMTPLGGSREKGSHKGYGLAVMVDIISSVLGGSAIGGHSLKTLKPGPTIDVGSFFMAIDPAAFRGLDDFRGDLDILIDRMHGTDPVDPAQPVLVPGEPEATARVERERDGVPMTETLRLEVKQVAEDCGAEFLLERPA